MQNELPFASKNFIACRDNIQLTNVFLFNSSTMSNTCSLSHFRVQTVSFSDHSFLQISGKDCLVKLEIWTVMTDDQP